MRRLSLLLVCALALPVPVAQAWTWPVDGPVLRPFSFDRDHPYAGGQHRGVDLGAPSGTSVLAPAEGVVSFAGTVPTGGKTVSIQTPFGYTATLLHLGSIGVPRGALVGEGAPVGTVGPSGVTVHSVPYVYFGLRETSDPQGYVDPLPFLPARSAVASGLDAEPAAVASAGVESAPADAPSSPSPATELAQPAAAEPAPAATASVEGQTVEPALAEASPSPAEAAPVAAPAVSFDPLEVLRPEGPVAAPASISADTTRIVLPGLDSRERLQPGARGVTGSHIRQVGSTSAPAGIGDRRAQAGSPAGADSQLAGEPYRGFVPTKATRGESRGRDSLRLALALAAFTLVARLAFGLRRASQRRTARIMSLPEPEQFVGREERQEDPGRAGLALRGREATSGPRGRFRRAGGHLRALPPPEGQRRPDGEWDGRARYAGDGHRGSRGRLAA